MSTRFDDITTDADDPADDGIPDLRPWRDVGWIFNDGDTQVIECQGSRTRARAETVVGEREE